MGIFLLFILPIEISVGKTCTIRALKQFLPIKFSYGSK